MDIATIIGMIAGAAVVAAAIFMGGSVGTFVNVPSLLIVVGGGLAATLIRFPIGRVFKALALGGQNAFKHKKTEALDLLEEISSLADVIRKNGPLGLENIEISNDSLAKGIQYIADGYERALIEESMEREKTQYLERLDEGSRVFKALGDAAPAFGMIGTLVGLVQMLSTMDDPSTIGPAMAVALLTTLYGAIIANLVCLPISDKLNGKAIIEDINQSMIIDGVLQIRDNKSPALIREMLVAYLPEKQRVEVAEAA
ncbi:MAG: MotA/TolQ/ExbB proton channel family protein [Pseudomonadota bacterium]